MPMSTSTKKVNGWRPMKGKVAMFGHDLLT
jgi:hypothetical protein